MAVARPAKRQRMALSAIDDLDLSPTTSSTSPPSTNDTTTRDKILSRAQHVLTTEGNALNWVSGLYQTNDVAIDGLVAAVDAILACQRDGGKVIVCGVGKSAYIGMKLVATCKSVGISTSFLHACEAVHGDLGDVKVNDVILFVSFSGKTPELLNMLAHLPETTLVIAMSSHLRQEDCPLLGGRPDSVLLPAPIPEAEETSFGLCAPTTSTTVALAVADMLALTVAEQLHGSKSREVFKRNHPGGAIGMTHKQVDLLKRADTKVEVFELPSPSISAESDD